MYLLDHFDVGGTLNAKNIVATHGTAEDVH